MMTSMAKIIFCIMLLSVNLACCTSINGRKRVRCDDCISVFECKAAMQYKNNVEYIIQYYCGITDAINVCCSKFKLKDDSPDHPNLKLLPDSCGRIYNAITYRLISGSLAAMYEFPWMVLISYNIGGSEVFQSSGTLINSRYVLTAAHCAQNVDIAGVRVGEYHIGVHPDCVEGVCESNLQDMSVEEIIVHKGYNMYENFINDIALLRLTKHVDTTFQNAAPICLPTTKKLQDGSIANKYATIAGWGITEHGRESSILLKLTITVLSDYECQTHYRHIPDSNSTQLCAGKKSQDSCKGDSGGPLMIQDLYKGTDRYIQYGIVSNGPSRCGSGKPGIYTDVRKYMKWILDNIRE